MLNRLKNVLKMFSTFLVAGALAAMVQYGVLIVLVQLAATNAVAASALGYAVAAVVNYYLNYRYTFRSKQVHWRAFSKFALVVLCGISLNTWFMHIGIEWFGWHYLLAQLLATALVLLWNFTANALWSFRDPNQTPLDIRQ